MMSKAPDKVSTTFKLRFEYEGELGLDIDLFKRSLPSNFQAQRKADAIYVTVRSDVVEDPRCQYLIDRELDRYFFLTGVKISATMLRRTIARSWALRSDICGALPKNVRPQKWTYELAIQLRLWSTAIATRDIIVKLLLLYQIIETLRPHPPTYCDKSKAPAPRTECRLVRNLIAHSGDVDGKELARYCEYIGYPALMLDITDPWYYEFISSKVPLMEGEAKKVIARALKP